MELGQEPAKRMNIYCVMSTVYMAYMYAYIPAHLYLGILGKLGIMYVPLQKRKKKLALQ